MKNNPHGYCLIINNHIFKNPRHNREGTLQDGGKYFLNSITSLGFFLWQFLKTIISSLLWRRIMSMVLPGFQRLEWQSWYQLEICHFQHLADGLKKDLLFVLGKRYCLNWLYVQLEKKWLLFHLSSSWLFSVLSLDKYLKSSISLQCSNKCSVTFLKACLSAITFKINKRKKVRFLKGHATDILTPSSPFTSCFLPSYFLSAHTTIRPPFAEKSS